METVVLFDGTQTTVYYAFNMWRSEIDGRAYCAQTKENLLRCIGECYSSVVPEKEPEPVIPLADILFKQIKTGKLEQKQSARRELLKIAKAGDEDAIKYLGRLPEKKISLQAKYLAKSLNKDFYEVTFYDLSENVSDLVLRARLVRELERLFEIK
jgi:hypothetical protein